MKKLLFIMLAFAWSFMISAQTHVVAKGESLQSIADKYNISIEKLIEANPGSDKLFYIGLKLNIPENVITIGASTASNEQVISGQNSSVAVHSEQAVASQSAGETTEDNPGLSYVYALEYGFLQKLEGSRGSHYAFSITMGANYYFMHKDKGVFAGGRIGYNSASFTSLTKISIGNYISETTDSHFITLPINVGYSWCTNDRKFGVTPLAGIDFNFCVGGKYKYKEIGSSIEDTTKFKKKTGVDARLGLMLRLYGINIGAAYVLPLNDNQEAYFGEDAYLSVCFGYGF